MPTCRVYCVNMATTEKGWNQGPGRPRLTPMQALAAAEERYNRATWAVRNTKGCRKTDARVLSYAGSSFAPFRMGWILANKDKLPADFASVPLMRVCETSKCVAGEHWKIQPGYDPEPIQAIEKVTCPTCGGKGTI